MNERSEICFLILSHAIHELQEIAAHLKKDAVNIIDVIKNIDEMNYTKKDEEKYKKKTVTLINTIKSHYEKKQEMQKSMTGRANDDNKKTK